MELDSLYQRVTQFAATCADGSFTQTVLLLDVARTTMLHRMHPADRPIRAPRQLSMLDPTDTVAPQSLPPGVLPHGDPSDDPATCAADRCDRQAVTVAWAYANLCDQAVWFWTGESHPWRLLTLIELTQVNGYLVQWEYSGQQRRTHVADDFRVFVQRRDLRRLGFRFA